MMNDELYHYGIKGQRWGVRRYQNKYGALTPAGKKRVAKLEKKYDELASIGALSDRGKKTKANVESEYKSLSGKSVRTAAKQKHDQEKADAEVKAKENTKTKSNRELTTDELRERVDRLRMEKDYIQLKQQISDLTPKQVSAGEKFMQTVGPKLADAAIETGKKALNDYLSDKLGTKDPIEQLSKAAEKAGYEKKIAEAESAKRKNRKEADAEAASAKSSTRSDDKTDTKTYSETVEGEGTSRSSQNSSSNKSAKRSDPIDSVWRDVTDDDVNAGMAYALGLLEDKK